MVLWPSEQERFTLGVSMGLGKGGNTGPWFCFETSYGRCWVYVDDIIFRSTKKSLCVEFEQMMHKKFQMSSMGELTFFLGLQVRQKDDGIFISQDKYVADTLKKFDFVTVKTTTSRPDIIFAVCACASDYARASLDWKYTTGGCQFLGKRIGADGQSDRPGPRSTLGGVHCSDRVLDLEKEKDAQAVEILKLKNIIKKLERKAKSRSGGTEVFDDTTAAEKDVNVVESVSIDGDAVTAASVIPDIDTAGPSNVSVVGPSISTAGDIFEDEMMTIVDKLMAIRSTSPRTTSVVIHDAEEEPRRATPVPTVQSQYKEQRIARERAAEQEAKDAALIAKFDNVQERMEAMTLLAAQPLQEEERENKIQKLYEREQKWINDFVPMDFEEGGKKAESSKKEAAALVEQMDLLVSLKNALQECYDWRLEADFENEMAYELIRISKIDCLLSSEVGDEVVHKELGDKMERAATTTSSFEAEQDSGSGPSLEQDLKQTKQVYGKALTKLVKKVKHLEDQLKSTTKRRKAKVVISHKEEDLVSEMTFKSYTRRRSTDSLKVSTAGDLFSTARDLFSTAKEFLRSETSQWHIKALKIWSKDLTEKILLHYGV
ncbi:putative ribonuclease H-like domain-containing protein [Tanacetum coccineum]|uniref:Ribonuclease H-like domain-containing protein n=1 Tax=Tanacetum coccineum TaxID=301880 RepID=A0ABQ4XTL5_9ASTR